MEDNTIILLPWPPTVNSYYSAGYGKVRYISAKGRVFRDEVIKRMYEQVPALLADRQLDMQLHVECILHPPDKRIRDLDNYMKALLDAITHSGLWADDSQIDQLCIYRGETVRNGACVVEIGMAGPVVPYSSSTHPPRI